MFEKRRNEKALQRAKNEMEGMTKEEKVKKLRRLRNQRPDTRPSHLDMGDDILDIELIWLYILFMDNDVVEQLEIEDNAEASIENAEELPSPEEEVVIAASVEEPAIEGITNEDVLTNTESDVQSFTNEDTPSYDSGDSYDSGGDSGGDCGCD